MNPGMQAGLRQQEVPQEEGQLSIFLAGMVAVVALIIFGVIGVTSVQLSRIHLLDAADAAALDASDALRQGGLYDGGLGNGLQLSNESVWLAAADHLAARPLPERLEYWDITAGTGTEDGRTAVVTVTGRAKIPVISKVLRAFGGGVTLTVTGTARSDLSP